MLDCNRHRPNGYKDKTWQDRIPSKAVDDFLRFRNTDLNRQQNLINKRFPQLAEARDQYLSNEQEQTMEEGTELPDIHLQDGRQQTINSTTEVPGPDPAMMTSS